MFEALPRDDESNEGQSPLLKPRKVVGTVASDARHQLRPPLFARYGNSRFVEREGTSYERDVLVVEEPIRVVRESDCRARRELVETRYGASSYQEGSSIFVLEVAAGGRCDLRARQRRG